MAIGDASGIAPIGGVETMAMPHRDNTIEAIKRLDALLEYAVMHGDETEAERIREESTGGCVGFAEGRRSRGARPTGARMSVV